MSDQNRDPFLRAADVWKLTGLSKGLAYEMIGEGTFPAPYRLSERVVAWRESEVRAWMDARPRVSIEKREVAA